MAAIKLNRPKVLNAMNKQLWLDFQTALKDTENDPNIKVLIITGEGRAFSTGADLKDSKGRSLEDLQRVVREIEARMREIDEIKDVRTNLARGSPDIVRRLAARWWTVIIGNVVCLAGGRAECERLSLPREMIE